ncbi:MAG: N-acetylmuramic acid 6-phosphate etherase [Planctomycetota bacterium]
MPPTPSLPPDRSAILTEQRNSRSARLHAMSALDCVALINREDQATVDAVKNASPAITAFIHAIEPGFLAGGRLIYVGAGTSGRLGVLDASEAPPTFCIEHGRIIGLIAGGDPALRVSSEGKEDDPQGAYAELETLGLTNRDGVLAIAAGGTTPYATGALACAKSLCTSTVTALLSCSPVPKPAATDHLITLETGPEVLTGSTRMKAGTATKMTLNIISTTLMVRMGRVYENLMVDMRASNAKLRDRAARVISTLTGLDRGAAFALLDRADANVKTAIVMHRRNVPRETAERLLAQSKGRLDQVIT